MIMPARTAKVNQDIQTRLAAIEEIIEALQADLSAMAADRRWLIQVVAHLAIDAERLSRKLPTLADWD